MLLALATWRMPSPRLTQVRSARGFSLVEVLLVVALVGTITAIAVPQFMTALTQYRTNSASREVAAQIRNARLAAVTTNRTMLVRFNCPGPRQYRVVQLTGVAAIDDAADRCAAPYPDADPVALPNNDGPPAILPDTVAFGALQDLRISTTGLVTPLTGGMPALIEVTNGQRTRQITVSASGRVRMLQ